MICDKCGASLRDDMEFCDKCGVRVEAKEQSAQEVSQEPAQAVVDEWISEEAEPQNGEPVPVASVGDKPTDIRSRISEAVRKVIPARMFGKEDKTFRFVGIGCLALFAVLYIINFFMFLDDICYPIGMGTEALGADIGATRVWMLIYWLLTLAPAVVSAMAIKSVKHPKWMIITGVSYTVLTVVMFGVWLSFEPGTLLMAHAFYDGMNMLAWYVVVDCISEMWYLKALLFLGAFAALYADRKKSV